MKRGQTTLYDILGVESTAPEKEIRVAFRRLTIANHPDRFSGAQRERAEERFQGITEAFNVLSHPESREKYDEEISQGGQAGAMNRTEIARRLAAKGAQLFREGNAAEALEHLRTAINHDDDCGRAHYFLGTILSRVDGRQREALRHMEKAAALEPNNATIRAEAAVLFLAAGMKSRAARFATQTLELDPDNTKAREVIAALDEQEKPKSEGLLGRFRRKG